MANLVINIQGLALCHFDGSNGNWKVFFPRAEDHDFKLIVDKINVVNGRKTSREYLPPPATRIDLKPTSITGLSIAQNDVATALDACVLHEEDIPLTSDISKYAGFLTLHDCFLQSRLHPEVPLKVDIWDARQPAGEPTLENPPTKEWKMRETIATEFLTSFVTDSDSSVEIEMQTDFEINQTSSLSVNQENGFTHIVTFSNDCEGLHCGTESDFKFFYNIIDENLLKTKRRFEMTLVDPSAVRARMGSPCGGIFVPENKLIIPNGI